MRRRALELEARGYRSIHDLPGELRLNPTQTRQVRAVKSGSLVVEPGLVEALREFEGPLAFIDFETVAPAIPVWRGCRPWSGSEAAPPRRGWSARPTASCSSCRRRAP